MPEQNGTPLTQPALPRKGGRPKGSKKKPVVPPLLNICIDGECQQVRSYIDGVQLLIAKCHKVGHCNG